MHALSKLRQWVNRDDGRHYRIGNRRVGAVESIGLLLFVVALLLWQLHAKAGISSIWSYASGGVGLLLAIVGNRDSHDGSGT